MKQFTMPVSFFNKHHKKLRVSRNDIYADRFDAGYCAKITPQIEKLVLKSYQSVVLPEENKNRILDLGTSSIIYASLHKSHFDYITICGKMLLEGLPCPRTIAGSNLLKGIIGWSVRQFTGIDLTKWGAIPVERDSAIPRTIHNLCNRIEALLKSDKPVLIFPEIEMTTNGDGYTIKTGRAYSGKIRKFAPALFSPAINASKEGKKVFIVPISVAYDFVAEEGYFSRLINADKMKKSENSLISLMGKLYYTFLESHFFFKMYRLGNGNIYIDAGEPILVEPNASKKELAQRAQEEAARCYRVTMPALVAYAISKGPTSRDQLHKSVERYSEMLKAASINFQPSANLKEDIESALQGLAERKIISNHGAISVKKPDVIKYYANTIAHHFENAESRKYPEDDR
ncbi:MAG: 1-acyl-sn-glycerol-3-phosphate acyltransferase [Bacteriovorax sp.]